MRELALEVICELGAIAGMTENSVLSKELRQRLFSSTPVLHHPSGTQILLDRTMPTKPLLDLEILLADAKLFTMPESDHPEPAMYRVTDFPMLFNGDCNIVA